MTDESLTLAFVGDISLAFMRRSGRRVDNFPEWRSILDAIGSHDCLVGNLECCLVDEHCPEEARQQIMATPACVGSVLKGSGFSALSLANNHMLDCGSKALAVTRERLAASGIQTFGAGMSLPEAENTVYLDRQGHRVAMLGACDNVEYYADNTRPGIAPLKKRRLGRRVRDAASKADLVIVSLHADLEFSPAPGRWRQRLSRWLVDQGAHLIIQHHPHVLQGVERYRGGLIAYSLGNFIFGLRGNSYQEHRAGVFDSAVMVVNVAFGSTPKLSYRMLPLRIGDDHFPRCLLDPHEKKEAANRIADLSRVLEDRRAHRRIWFQRCREEARRRLLSTYYAFARRQWKSGGSIIWRVLTGGEDRRWILGFLSLGHL